MLQVTSGVDRLPQLEVREDLDYPPSFDEYQRALASCDLRNQKRRCWCMVALFSTEYCFRECGTRVVCLLLGGMPWGDLT